MEFQLRFTRSAYVMMAEHDISIESLEMKIRETLIEMRGSTEFDGDLPVKFVAAIPLGERLSDDPRDERIWVLSPCKEPATILVDSGQFRLVGEMSDGPFAGKQMMFPTGDTLAGAEELLN